MGREVMVSSGFLGCLVLLFLASFQNGKSEETSAPRQEWNTLYEY